MYHFALRRVLYMATIHFILTYMFVGVIYVKQSIMENKNKVLKAMKIFYFLPIITLLFAFKPVEKAPTAKKVESFKQILSSSPWQQSAFTVSPAIQMSEHVAVSDLYYHQDEEARSSVIKFDASGNYYVLVGESAMESTMFAARNGEATETTTQMDEEDYDVTEDVTTNILETGSWSMNDNGDLVLVADNGRMKEQILHIEKLGTDQLVINFTREIGGEYHTFTQVFDAKPYLELGW